jgi:hypothetical protein
VNSLPIRAALVVLAVLASAWLAVGVRAVALENDAKAVVEKARAGAATPAEVEGAQDDLRAADLLSPSKDTVIREGELMASLGRMGEGAILGYSVTRDEPENLRAWFLVWAAEPDAAKKAEARRRILELNPWFDYALQRR